MLKKSLSIVSLLSLAPMLGMQRHAQSSSGSLVMTVDSNVSATIETITRAVATVKDESKSFEEREAALNTVRGLISVFQSNTLNDSDRAKLSRAFMLANTISARPINAKATLQLLLTKLQNTLLEEQVVAASSANISRNPLETGALGAIQERAQRLGAQRNAQQERSHAAEQQINRMTQELANMKQTLTVKENELNECDETISTLTQTLGETSANYQRTCTVLNGVVKAKQEIEHEAEQYKVAIDALQAQIAIIEETNAELSNL